MIMDCIFYMADYTPSCGAIGFFKVLFGVSEFFWTALVCYTFYN